MRKKVFSKRFAKTFFKLKGQERLNVIKKIDEIVNCNDINHYKNLKKPLEKFKRVHVNNCFVILFFGDDDTVYFEEYLHHDKAYW
jgi:mRNA-degrading endonuclease RelE of RelBE toxin-antitoxin system